MSSTVPLCVRPLEEEEEEVSTLTEAETTAEESIGIIQYLFKVAL